MSPPTPAAVVRVEHVSKKYTRTLRRSLFHGLVDLGRNFLGRPAPTDRLRKGEFWAVDDVSFEVAPRERVGIIGVNGSGKTTLLRMIAGILPPDRGEIGVRGRLTAMIAVGAGFHPHLTGRENVYLNGALLGLPRETIDARLAEILDFAEIGEFVDSPVAIYSSGMRGRLGFAVSTALEPDVLLLDEVLATGDLAFRQRCFRRLDEISRETAVVLVTHMPTHIRRVCDRVIWMEEGRIRLEGDTDLVLDAYAVAMREIDTRFAARSGRLPGGADDVEYL